MKNIIIIILLLQSFFINNAKAADMYSFIDIPLIESTLKYELVMSLVLAHVLYIILIYILILIYNFIITFSIIYEILFDRFYKKNICGITYLLGFMVYLENYDKDVKHCIIEVNNEKY